MDVRYKVTVAPFDAEPVVMQLFEARSDADRYWKDIFTDGEDNILYTMPYKSVVVTMWEFHEGTWVMLARQVVSR